MVRIQIAHRAQELPAGLAVESRVLVVQMQGQREAPVLDRDTLEPLQAPVGVEFEMVDQAAEGLWVHWVLGLFVLPTYLEPALSYQTDVLNAEDPVEFADRPSAQHEDREGLLVSKLLELRQHSRFRVKQLAGHSRRESPTVVQEQVHLRGRAKRAGKKVHLFRDVLRIGQSRSLDDHLFPPSGLSSLNGVHATTAHVGSLSLQHNGAPQRQGATCTNLLRQSRWRNSPVR